MRLLVRILSFLAGIISILAGIMGILVGIIGVVTSLRLWGSSWRSFGDPLGDHFGDHFGGLWGSLGSPGWWILVVWRDGWGIFFYPFGESIWVPFGYLLGVARWVTFSASMNVRGGVVGGGTKRAGGVPTTKLRFELITSGYLLATSYLSVTTVNSHAQIPG